MEFTLDDLERLKPRSRSQSFDSKHLENCDRYEVGPPGRLLWKQPWAFDWHSQIWPWMTLRGQKTKVTDFDVKYAENGKSYDVGPNRGYVNSCSLDLLSKIIGLLVAIFIDHRSVTSVSAKVRIGPMQKPITTLWVLNIVHSVHPIVVYFV